jgi:hypothetical protein
MSLFDVRVKRELTQYGSIIIEAIDGATAVRLIAANIKHGGLSPDDPSIAWDKPVFVDDSFSSDETVFLAPKPR